jgi:hypothetical protein
MAYAERRHFWRGPHRATARVPRIVENGALTTQRKHHRRNGFFDFCVENEWLHKNPSKKTKPVQASLDPTDYDVDGGES